jgi:outer membrane protein assembly factor BamB
MTRPRHGRYVLAALFALALTTAATRADDWPQWGGPRRDLVWREDGIVDSLPTGELPRIWSAPIGAGYAGPAVAAGRVYVADRPADVGLERVLCFNAEDGAPVWSHKYAAEYGALGYPLGPRATPTVDGNRVYTLGAVGHLFCFDAASGDVVWQKLLPADFGTKLPTWGMAGPPLVDGDQLIILAGGAGGSLIVSLDKATGKELWRALDDPEVGYCPPVIMEFGGKRQLIVWHPTAVSAIDPDDKGKLLWEVPFAIKAGMTIATPRKVGNGVFVTGFYCGPMWIDLGDDGTTPVVRWRTAAGNNEVKNDSLHAVMCTPLVTKDFVYGVGSYGDLRCLDAATGKLVWETREATGEGRWWNAFIVPLGDEPIASTGGRRVFIHNEQGDLILAELTGAGYREIGRSKLIEPTQPIQRRMTVWSHPAFAMRSVFARNDKELIRVDLAAKDAAARPTP